MSLNARLVDPRDVTLEESEPTYRLYFWSVDGTRCREYDVMGADEVGQVIEWADGNVEVGETYVLGVRWQEASRPPGSAVPSVAFIRLKGEPPPHSRLVAGGGSA